MKPKSHSKSTSTRKFTADGADVYWRHFYDLPRGTSQIIMFHFHCSKSEQFRLYQAVSFNLVMLGPKQITVSTIQRITTKLTKLTQTDF